MSHIRIVIRFGGEGRGLIFPLPIPPSRRDPPNPFFDAPPGIRPERVPPPEVPPRAPQAPTPQRPPFPTGPAANDPIFSIGRAILRRGLAAIGLITSVLDLLNLGQIEIFNAQQRALEELLKRAKQKAADAQEPREVTVPADADIPLPEPTPSPLPSAPPRPVFEPFPEAPAPQIPSPVPVELPTPSIPTPTIPAPRPVPAPSPLPIPGTVPLPGIRVSPFFLPSPGVRSSPLQSPRLVPIGDPLPLTPSTPTVPQFGTGFAPFQFLADQPQPQTDPARERCQVVKRRRRKKGKCREGFFRETPGGTEFTTWRERTCGPPTLRTI